MFSDKLMTNSSLSGKDETRFVFRLLAGLLAAFLLLVGLPAALSEAGSGGGEAWFCAFCCLYAGVGLAVGARTGKWMDFRKRDDTQGLARRDLRPDLAPIFVQRAFTVRTPISTPRSVESLPEGGTGRKLDSN